MNLYNIILYHNIKNKYYTIKADQITLENKINKILKYDILKNESILIIKKIILVNKKSIF